MAKVAQRLLPLFCLIFLTAIGKLEPFVDVSASAGITATLSGDRQLFDDDFVTGYLGIGQAWGDYDRDGWLDLYVSGNRDASVLYRNSGDGSFSVSPLTPRVALVDADTGGAVWADYDNDGWLDLYVLNHGANILFHSESGRGFTDVTDRAGVGDAGKGTTAAWGDYDGDSYLDLYVVNWSCFPECGDPNITREHDAAHDTLYHNRGDGTFVDVTHLLDYSLLLGAGFSASFTDYDNDGDPDIYVVNDQFKNMLGNILWRNDGAGCGGWCWRETSIEAGARTFDDVADDAGVVVGPSSAVGWGTVFFDYNNDSWLDLFLTATEFIQFDIVSGPEGMMFEYRDFFSRIVAMALSTMSRRRIGWTISNRAWAWLTPTTTRTAFSTLSWATGMKATRSIATPARKARATTGSTSVWLAAATSIAMPSARAFTSPPTTDERCCRR